MMTGNGKKKAKKRSNEAKKYKSAETNRAASSINTHARQQGSFPLPFPANLPRPNGLRFLRNEEPYRNSFQTAVETSYEGFAVDNDIFNTTEKDFPKEGRRKHNDIEKSLAQMEEAGFFRTDVTQPFGLGTKCAKTYVTRCLVGKAGTTYKYLGLRMFAHPWDRRCGNGHDNSPRNSFDKALGIIKSLNTTLTERTKYHLAELDKKRRRRGATPVKGRAGFDITLINRMEITDGLKNEPMVGEGKCSVSWHADSSLEHYSTIAVYHQLISRKANVNNSSRWSVGLRVAHNSEGPQASRRGTDISVATEAPPISVSLPSRSTYYLLDDFNHHHQHAVIAEGKTPGIRFSSTHRLLRDSHNVEHILKRCKTTTDNFHKKGPTLWRSEQLLLTELESEWIRQFYIQGKAHHDLLWYAWEYPIVKLLKFWSMLEDRTKTIIDLLQHGAEALLSIESSSTNLQPPSRQERKLREKRKKAQKSVQDIIERGGLKGGALVEIYEPMACLLEERATMRELWLKRENDGVFHELSHDNRPMSVPFIFLQEKDDVVTTNREAGHSKMPGSPKDLRNIALSLRSCGAAFDSSDKIVDSAENTTGPARKQSEGHQKCKAKRKAKSKERTGKRKKRRF